RDERMQLRLLALLVDDAARRAAPELDPGRAFEHIDLGVIERVAVIVAEVAHPVEEDVVLRAKAADGKVVALRTAFACGKADARRIAKRITQRGNTLVSKDLVGDCRNGLRRVQKWRRQLTKSNAIGR